MRIIFMGTPEFAVASLDLLIKNNFNIVGVVTAPDKPSGRGQQIHASAVKNYAIENKLHLLQPQNLKSEEFVEELKSLKADLQIVVAFRMLPEAVWNMPPEGTYNLHASLLPKYRGAAPINWAVINGEHESGVTTFKLKHEIDTGNILFTEKVPIKITDTAGDLHDTLMKKGAQLLLKTAQAIENKVKGNGDLHFIMQNSVDAVHAPKIFKDTCRIDWNRPVMEMYNLIRGLSPYPTAFTYIKDNVGQLKTIKIFAAEFMLAEHSYAVGSITSDNSSYLQVACAGGMLRLLDVQVEGKKRMLIPEFLRGYRINSSSLMI